MSAYAEKTAAWNPRVTSDGPAQEKGSNLGIDVRGHGKQHLKCPLPACEGKTKKNFSVDVDQGKYHCFRCGWGRSPGGRTGRRPGSTSNESDSGRMNNNSKANKPNRRRPGTSRASGGALPSAILHTILNKNASRHAVHVGMGRCCWFRCTTHKVCCTTSSESSQTVPSSFRWVRKRRGLYYPIASVRGSEKDPRSTSAKVSPRGRADTGTSTRMHESPLLLTPMDCGQSPRRSGSSTQQHGSLSPQATISVLMAIRV